MLQQQETYSYVPPTSQRQPGGGTEELTPLTSPHLKEQLD